MDYPFLKKFLKKIKKKVILATWSDSEDSSFKEEIQEEANLCLMAQEEEVISKTKYEFTFNELHNVFNDLLDEFKKPDFEEQRS